MRGRVPSKTEWRNLESKGSPIIAVAIEIRSCSVFVETTQCCLGRSWSFVLSPY